MRRYLKHHEKQSTYHLSGLCWISSLGHEFLLYFFNPATSSFALYFSNFHGLKRVVVPDMRFNIRCFTLISG